VEYPVLEITWLDPESGLVMGDFGGTEDSLDRSLRRENVDKYPPFSEKISCLAPIPGESRDSCLGPGLDLKGEIVVISAVRERFEGEFFLDLPTLSNRVHFGRVLQSILTGTQRRNQPGENGGLLRVFHEALDQEGHSFSKSDLSRG
jgi:hypothetical protein